MTLQSHWKTHHARRLSAALLVVAVATAIAVSPVEASAPRSLAARDSASASQAADTSASLPRDRVLWRFRADADSIMTRPVVAPDGTIYVTDTNSHLYALTPDGQLKWVLNNAGNAGVDLGPDGTIYVGNTLFVTAVRPDGTIKWKFEQSPEAFILLGPSVGPDGNIYGVASSGLGIFSLTPNGKLRWAIPEPYDRLIVEYQELAFGPAPGGGSQLYFHANKHFKAVRLDGKVTFTINGDGNDPCGGGQPVVGTNGNAYTTNWQIGEGEKLGSYSPSGKRNWTFVHQPNNCQSNPTVGPDGKVFIVWNNSRLFSLTPKGKAREIALDFESGLQNPAASPLGDQVLVTGGGQGRPAVFESFKARNGKLLWKVSLPDEDGHNQVPMSAIGPRFAPDGQTAYMGVIVSGVYDHSYLYAIDTSR